MALGDTAFPRQEPPSVRSRGAARLALLGAVAGFLLASSVAHLRLSPAAAQTIWAEDGLIFLNEDLALGSWDALLTPYAGYAHLVPRAAAAVAGALPLEYAEDVFTVSASAVVGLCAVATYLLSSGHLPSRAVRLLLAAAVVLLPVAGLEAAGNVANSHWFLMAAAFWACSSRPCTPTRTAMAALVVVLAMGSDPLTLILAPLVVGRALLLRGWRDHVVTAAYLLTATAQLGVVLSTTRAEAAAGASPVAVAEGYFTQVPFALAVGPDRAGDLFAEHGWSAVVAVTAVPVLAALVALWGPPRLGLLAVSSGLASVAFFVVPVVVSWSPAFDPRGPYGLAITGARYLIVPMLLLLGLVGAALQALVVRAHVVVAAVVLLALLAALAPSVARGFRPDPDIRAGPSWDAALAGARSACVADGSLEVAVLKTAPADRRQWVVTVPCSRLR